jgi:hypothetical protein
MPHVFTGKVLIAGDELDAYVAARREAEVARASFQRMLDLLHAVFAASLVTKYFRRTVLKHRGIVELFIHFLCYTTDVARPEEVTRGMVNSHVRRWYGRKVLHSMDPDSLRVALRKFFMFLEARMRSTHFKHSRRFADGSPG